MVRLGRISRSMRAFSIFTCPFSVRSLRSMSAVRLRLSASAGATVVERRFTAVSVQRTIRLSARASTFLPSFSIGKIRQIAV